MKLFHEKLNARIDAERTPGPEQGQKRFDGHGPGMIGQEDAQRGAGIRLARGLHARRRGGRPAGAAHRHGGDEHGTERGKQTAPIDHPIHCSSLGA